MYGMRYDKLYNKYINTTFFELLTIIVYGFAVFGVFIIFKSLNDKSYNFISYPDRIIIILYGISLVIIHILCFWINSINIYV